jgi:hypothetical protein
LEPQRLGLSALVDALAAIGMANVGVRALMSSTRYRLPGSAQDLEVVVLKRIAAGQERIRAGMDSL